MMKAFVLMHNLWTNFYMHFSNHIIETWGLHELKMFNVANRRPIWIMMLMFWKEWLWCKTH